MIGDDIRAIVNAGWRRQEMYAEDFDKFLNTQNAAWCLREISWRRDLIEQYQREIERLETMHAEATERIGNPTKELEAGESVDQAES
jgi:DNA-binding transcriptional regulator GbsR (MarR family)